MTLHIHRYIEIPAPPEETRALLAERTPFGAERLGTMWQWLDELWTIQVHTFDDGRIQWYGRCPALPEASLLLTATLSNAVVTTHIQLHLAVTLPNKGLIHTLARYRQQRRIAALLDQTLAEIQVLAQQRVPTPATPLSLSVEPTELAAALRTTHPRTVAAFEAMNALPNLAAVTQLDQRWQATERGAVGPDVYEQRAVLPPTIATFDLIYAGGGLALLHAAVMAVCYGYRVLLFDRGEVGCAHREWNISDHELSALVRIGLFTQSELEQVVMRRYRDGVVRFWPESIGVAGSALHMPNVLNVALDAAGLLQLTRRKLEAAGGYVLDHRTFRRVIVRQPGEVVVEVEQTDQATECYGARLLIDGMGATSALALHRFAGQPFAGVCPTVGTVVDGLERGSLPTQHNPDVGDILVSVDHAQRGRQLIWEGFAGRGDELTVYVFYYDLLRKHQERRTKNQEPSIENRKQGTGNATLDTRRSLLDLFEDYFALLPTYKRPGPRFRHIKPVYGFIPARHTQRRNTVPLLAGVLPVGDSAAQQSPLTFCGFGSHVRNLHRTTSLLDYALRDNLLAPQLLGYISAYQANVALNWVFSRFMQPWDNPTDVNRLQNVFARVMNEVGVEIAVRFFQDQMTWRDYGRIVNHTLAIYKPIIPTALRVLGARGATQWIADWLRFSVVAGGAALGRAVGETALDAFENQLSRQSPALAFQLRARRAEWRVMGWN
jgi:lycopene cyclase CruA